MGYGESIGGLHLSDDDFNDLTAATQRVYDLMKDGQWHSRDAIEKAAGQREGLRRMRELRQKGMEVETVRLDKPGRVFEYRLIVADPWKGAFDVSH